MKNVRQYLSNTDPSLKEGLDLIYTLFLQPSQGVSYHNALLCTRRHKKLYLGYTRTIVYKYMYILSTLASSYKSCLLSYLALMTALWFR